MGTWFCNWSRLLCDLIQDCATYSAVVICSCSILKCPSYLARSVKFNGEWIFNPINTILLISYFSRWSEVEMKGKKHACYGGRKMILLVITVTVHWPRSAPSTSFQVTSCYFAQKNNVLAFQNFELITGGTKDIHLCTCTWKSWLFHENRMAFWEPYIIAGGQTHKLCKMLTNNSTVFRK